MLKEVYIVNAVRTPIGSFGGVFTSLTATQLGGQVIKSLVDQSTLPAEAIEEVLFGNVCSANLGQAPARQAALYGGLPFEVSCTTINKVCASGMKALMFGAQSIALGQRGVVLVGGMESMSNVPFYLPKTRWGNKYGSFETVDGLQKDGLMDAYDHAAMGVSADQTALKYQISREQQDDFAIRSYTLAAKSWAANYFKDEVIPVQVELKPGQDTQVVQDEEYTKVNLEKIPFLKPAFSRDGTVTAANASTINDGATAILLVSAEKLKEYNLTPMARIVSFADAEQEPQWFTTTPAIATPLALKYAGIKIDEIDFFEVNEAFAVVALAYAKILHVDIDKINVRGGAVALGHPLGNSGARIICTLAHILKDHRSRYGLAAICNGGGGASAVVLENLI
ncbi:MAG: thiolase family protein [Saprospiraceae bacterium]|nr:thiolase family protein [Saprospiraceae bacterium]MBP8943648.1 thiolase family protein [Saprospiraceae bacterium]